MFDLSASPTAHTAFSQFEIVLGHGIKKVGKDDYLAAMDYGRKSGYFTANNLLTKSGMTLAQFAHF
jgi:hypothetical protein